MFGVESPGLIGKHLDFVFQTAEQKAQFRALLSELVKQRAEPTTYTATNWRSDGEPFEVRVKWNWFHDSDGDLAGTISIVSDVTLERRAQAKLAEEHQRFDDFLEANPTACGIYDRDLRLVAINSAGLRWFPGKSREDLLGVHMSQLSSSPNLALFERVLETGEPISIRRYVPPSRNDFGDVVLDLRAFKVGDGLGVTTDDVTQQVRIESSLALNERRLEAAQVLARLGSWEMDLTNTNSSVHWSRGLYEVFGVDPEVFTPSFEGVLELVHPRDREKLRSAVGTAIAEKGEYRVEYRAVRPDGREIQIHTWGAVVCDAAGNASKLIGVSQDASIYYEAESQRLRLRELDHRVKNNLSQILAILHLTEKTSTDLSDFSTRFSERIRSMARLHAALAQRAWEGATLEEIVLQSMNADAFSEQVRLSGPAVMTTANVALPLGLALHELTTNSLKYGALSASQGRVNIEWSGDFDQGVVLEWTEESGPDIREQPALGVGLSLVRAVLEDEIGGQFNIEFPATGVECRVSLPSGSKC